MGLVKFCDVVQRANTKEDKDNTDKIYYVGGEHIDSNNVLITERGIIKGSTIGPMFYFGFKAGQVLFVSRNPHLRKAGMVTFDGICSEKTFVLETKDEDVLLQRFLPFIMQSNHFWSYMEAHKSGSVNYFINWSTLANYEFDLPDIEEQKRLTELLWAIKDTKYAYEKLNRSIDDVVKSRFIEMFGLPFSEGWPVNGKFADFTLKMLKGPFGSDMKKSLFVEKGSDTYKVYVQVNAIQQDETLGEYYISKEYYDSKMHRFEVFPGEYLITCDGTLGKFIRLDEAMEPGVISPSMLSLKLNEERIVPRFFETYWSLFVLEHLISKTRNTALVHLPSAKAIGNIDVFIPDINDQLRFAEMAEQSDRSKNEIQKCIEIAEKLLHRIIDENIN